MDAGDPLVDKTIRELVELESNHDSTKLDLTEESKRIILKRFSSIGDFVRRVNSRSVQLADSPVTIEGRDARKKRSLPGESDTSERKRRKTRESSGSDSAEERSVLSSIAWLFKGMSPNKQQQTASAVTGNINSAMSMEMERELLGVRLARRDQSDSLLSFMNFLVSFLPYSCSAEYTKVRQEAMPAELKSTKERAREDDLESLDIREPGKYWCFNLGHQRQPGHMLPFMTVGALDNRILSDDSVLRKKSYTYSILTTEFTHLTSSTRINESKELSTLIGVTPSQFYGVPSHVRKFLTTEFLFGFDDPLIPSAKNKVASVDSLADINYERRVLNTSSFTGYYSSSLRLFPSSQTFTRSASIFRIEDDYKDTLKRYYREEYDQSTNAQWGVLNLVTNEGYYLDYLYDPTVDYHTEPDGKAALTFFLMLHELERDDGYYAQAVQDDALNLSDYVPLTHSRNSVYERYKEKMNNMPVFFFNIDRHDIQACFNSSSQLLDTECILDTARMIRYRLFGKSGEQVSVNTVTPGSHNESALRRESNRRRYLGQVLDHITQPLVNDYVSRAKKLMIDNRASAYSSYNDAKLSIPWNTSLPAKVLYPGIAINKRRELQLSDVNSPSVYSLIYLPQEEFSTADDVQSGRRFTFNQANEKGETLLVYIHQCIQQLNAFLFDGESKQSPLHQILTEYRKSDEWVAEQAAIIENIPKTQLHWIVVLDSENENLLRAGILDPMSIKKFTIEQTDDGPVPAFGDDFSIRRTVDDRPLFVLKKGLRYLTGPGLASEFAKRGEHRVYGIALLWDMTTALESEQTRVTVPSQILSTLCHRIQTTNGFTRLKAWPRTMEAIPSALRLAHTPKSTATAAATTTATTAASAAALPVDAMEVATEGADAGDDEDATPRQSNALALEIETLYLGITKQNKKARRVQQAALEDVYYKYLEEQKEAELDDEIRAETERQFELAATIAAKEKELEAFAQDARAMRNAQ